MTDQEIIEGNKLIAEFMGEKNIRIHESNVWMDENPVTHNPPNSVHARYDTSWDWLMPVVEKIESLDDGYEVIIRRTSCSIMYDQETKVSLVYCPNKMLSVWSAVIKFIKWYNQNK